MNALVILILYVISIYIFYLIIKAAIKNGVREAISDLENSVLAIKQNTEELKKSLEDRKNDDI